ncbi:MAG TPA: CoA ester lyase [Gammaproteobacteria bacterium]
MDTPVDVPAIAPPRSMLFVPGDSERKLAKARDTAADALILDLEDAVDPARKGRARDLTAEFLHGEREPGRTIFVRINALDEPEARADLDAILPARPDGLVVPKVRAADDVARLSVLLDALEPRAGVPPGATAIMPIATETPAGVFALGRYAGASPRLAYLTWGAEDLSAALGAETAVDADGEWLPPYQLVRALCLLAAADAGVPAIDTVHTDLVDETRLLRQALAAKRDGFAGKLAIHPAQVDLLNEVFTPSREEVERARRIVAAFEAAPGVGAISLDGRMLDRPHLARARRVIALAERRRDLRCRI